jgi:hypothetical protein
MTAWLEKNATVTLECLPEDLQIEGNASAIDPETDREQEQWIRDQLDAGNDWAWCCARVTVTFGDYSGEADLGACSYDSEASFRECMLADMVHCACVDLVAQLMAARETAQRIWDLASLLQSYSNDAQRKPGGGV